MNQVQEMLKLTDPGRVNEALARLGGLFDMMVRQPGFLRAEVTRDVADAASLLVLHAWERLEDWQAFQTSAWKVAFSASRPESLYTFVPVGMNWTLVAGDEARAGGRYVRRVMSSKEPPACDETVFTSAGDDPSYAGWWLTLEHRDEALGDGDWFEVLLTRSKDAVAARR
jgi:heme-degrading monooxygenase HmoA